MKFTVEIDCSNAAFEIDPYVEIKRILRNLAAEVSERCAEFDVADGTVTIHRWLWDQNGNRVGFAALK